jgi:hypothetical protein
LALANKNTLRSFKNDSDDDVISTTQLHKEDRQFDN